VQVVRLNQRHRGLSARITASSPHLFPRLPRFAVDEDAGFRAPAASPTGATDGSLRSTVRPLAGLGPGDRTIESKACVSLALRPRGSSTRRHTSYSCSCSRPRAPTCLENTIGLSPFQVFFAHRAFNASPAHHRLSLRPLSAHSLFADGIASHTTLAIILWPAIAFLPCWWKHPRDRHKNNHRNPSSTTQPSSVVFNLHGTRHYVLWKEADRP